LDKVLLPPTFKELGVETTVIVWGAKLTVMVEEFEEAAAYVVSALIFATRVHSPAPDPVKVAPVFEVAERMQLLGPLGVANQLTVPLPVTPDRLNI